MNSPAIRFAGFTEDWEQRKLFDAIKKIIDFRGRTPKKIGLDWSESGYLALSALNVKDGYIDITADANFGSQELYDRWMDGHELRKGQVLFTTEAPMGNVAQVPDNAGYILSQRTIAFDVDPEIIIEDFLFTLLRSPNMFRALSALSSGGTAKGVSQKSMSQIDTIIPKNLEEQTQLAAFFISLDRLITLHQREHDKTVNIKKALLEKMFPKDGEDKPEIRFAGFTEAWKQRKLGEFATRIVRKNKQLESALPLTISSTYGLVDQIAYFNNRVASRDVSNYYLIKRGEFAYNKSYSDGFPWGTIKRLDRYEMGVLSTLYIVFSLNTDMVDSDYFVTYYETDNWHREVAIRAAEGARNHGLLNISAEDFFDTAFKYPKGIGEQVKIGQLFAELDRLIALHQRELTKLQNIKKALLEKMFV